MKNSCHVKGYLCYKAITSPNVSSKAQVIFRSQDIQVFVFLTIPTSTKSVMS